MNKYISFRNIINNQILIPRMSSALNFVFQSFRAMQNMEMFLEKIHFILSNYKVALNPSKSHRIKYKWLNVISVPKF